MYAALTRAAGFGFGAWPGLSAAFVAAQGVAIEGQVLALDSETRQTPVAGAIVVARWTVNVPMLVESRTECRGIEIATTDADGRYRMAALTGMLTLAGEPQLRAYAPGYDETRALLLAAGRGKRTGVQRVPATSARNRGDHG